MKSFGLDKCMGGNKWDENSKLQRKIMAIANIRAYNCT